jgi:hypothetical protein
LVIGDAVFSISYHGGDGNDVELTQITPPIASQIGGISSVPGNQIEIKGTGLPGATYNVLANQDLSTTNWTKIGTTICDPQTGAWTFVDAGALNYSKRFYRLQAP